MTKNDRYPVHFKVVFILEEILIFLSCGECLSKANYQ